MLVKRLKRIVYGLLVLFFPLGILFCLGRNLFGGSFAQFLGGCFLFVGGMLLCLWLIQPEMIMNFIHKVTSVFG